MIYDIQKASLLKRITAFILDLILLCVLGVGVASLMSGILHYDSYYETLDACYAKYEQQFDTSFNITQADFNALSAEQQQRYNDALEALNKDDEALTAYNMLIYLSLIIATVSVLGAYLVLEFAVPLVLGNGQTVGKKVFAIGLMKSNGVKINAVSLFVRTILGKFTIETMVPLLLAMMMFWGAIGIVAPLVILGILILEVVLMITSRTNSMIHDTLAQTIAVDLHSQLIFGSEGELMDYKKRAHEEMVRRQHY